MAVFHLMYYFIYNGTSTTVHNRVYKVWTFQMIIKFMAYKFRNTYQYDNKLPKDGLAWRI